MMHVWALLIKFAAIGTTLFSFLSIFNTASLTTILVISVLTTVVSYFAGDLYILPKFGNFIASVGDFGLSFLIIWIISAFTIESSASLLAVSFFSALTIAGVEALFHLYVNNHILSNSAESYLPGVYREDKMLTEFSEEFESKHLNSKPKEKEEK